MLKAMVSVVILITFVLVPYTENSTRDYAPETSAVLKSAENSPVVQKQFIKNEENYYPLGRYGDTEYFWRVEEDNCVLYAIIDGETIERQLAVFERWCDTITDHIQNFGICGDWIIASVGHHEGSAAIFYGYFACLKKDGSEFKRFWLTESNKFVIVDDWIYYNFYDSENRPEYVFGCYRIRPDGTDKQYMGDKIYDIISYEEDGYIYGTYDTGKTIPRSISGIDEEYGYPIYDLIRCKPDGSGAITLFSGETLPRYKDSNSVGYYNVIVENSFVIFTAYVHGYSEGDSWRGHTMYSAEYRVNKDGSNLTLLNEN